MKVVVWNYLTNYFQVFLTHTRNCFPSEKSASPRVCCNNIIPRWNPLKFFSLQNIVLFSHQNLNNNIPWRPCFDPRVLTSTMFAWVRERFLRITLSLSNKNSTATPTLNVFWCTLTRIIWGFSSNAIMERYELLLRDAINSKYLCTEECKIGWETY